MYRRSLSLIPLARCTGSPSMPARVQARNIWDSVRAPDVRSLIRDMNREMERMERNMFRNMPFSFSFPRLIPIADHGAANRGFFMNIEVDGYKPEDIKISLKDGVLKVEGKMDRTSEDGKSRMQHTFVREFTIPENVDLSNLKSFIDNNGVLLIEAPLKAEEAPKSIPIEIEGKAEASVKG